MLESKPSVLSIVFMQILNVFFKIFSGFFISDHCSCSPLCTTVYMLAQKFDIDLIWPHRLSQVHCAPLMACANETVHHFPKKIKTFFSVMKTRTVNDQWMTCQVNFIYTTYFLKQIRLKKKCTNKRWKWLKPISHQKLGFKTVQRHKTFVLIKNFR